MAIKEFLMQNLSLIALLYKVTEYPSKEGDNSSNSASYSRKTSLICKKGFRVQNRSSQPKIYPHVNFSNFQVEENFFILQIFAGRSR